MTDTYNELGSRAYYACYIWEQTELTGIINKKFVPLFKTVKARDFNANNNIRASQAEIYAMDASMINVVEVRNGKTYICVYEKLPYRQLREILDMRANVNNILHKAR